MQQQQQQQQEAAAAAKIGKMELWPLVDILFLFYRNVVSNIFIYTLNNFKRPALQEVAIPKAGGGGSSSSSSST